MSAKNSPSWLQMRETEQMRLAHLLSKMDDAILPAEAHQHGEYSDGFVMHVESQTVASTKRHKGFNSFVRLHENGQIDDAQFIASQTIAMVAEKIGGDVSIRSASLEARVDNSGGNRNLIVEHLQGVIDEIAYKKWFQRLPAPRAMIVQMLVENRSLKATARKFRMGWPAGRIRLVRALDLFTDIREKVSEQVDDEDIRAAHFRLGLDFRA